jgi:hypothetical protein
MSGVPAYVRIAEGAPLPDISRFAPFRAVLVIAAGYSPDWQDKVSDWLVASGCLYMMAWGPDCSSWDDSVDCANQRRFDFGEIPERQFVTTTWHEHESLDDVFWYAHSCAHDPYVELASIIVHLSNDDAEAEMIGRYVSAEFREE